jgi:hypothetical protein
MEVLCPRLCPKAVLQRPLSPQELSQISNHARAEITLLRQAPLICENCRSVYLSTADETMLLGMLHPTGQWESETFPETLDPLVALVKNSGKLLWSIACCFPD